jgi:hypothetical protein
MGLRAQRLRPRGRQGAAGQAGWSPRSLLACDLKDTPAPRSPHPTAHRARLASPPAAHRRRCSRANERPHAALLHSAGHRARHPLGWPGQPGLPAAGAGAGPHRAGARLRQAAPGPHGRDRGSQGGREAPGRRRRRCAASPAAFCSMPPGPGPAAACTGAAHGCCPQARRIGTHTHNRRLTARARSPRRWSSAARTPRRQTAASCRSRSSAPPWRRRSTRRVHSAGAWRPLAGVCWFHASSARSAGPVLRRALRWPGGCCELGTLAAAGAGRGAVGRRAGARATGGPGGHTGQRCGARWLGRRPWRPGCCRAVVQRSRHAGRPRRAALPPAQPPASTCSS